jgi:hypothetical protein
MCPYILLNVPNIIRHENSEWRRSIRTDGLAGKYNEASSHLWHWFYKKSLKASKIWFLIVVGLSGSSPGETLSTEM